jgi:hypothetical protein
MHIGYNLISYFIFYVFGVLKVHRHEVSYVIWYMASYQHVDTLECNRSYVFFL